MRGLIHHALSLFLLIPFAPQSTSALSSSDATFYFSNLDTESREGYINWLANDGGLSSYPRHAFLPTADDPDNGAAIFWKIDGDRFNLAIAVYATGWVGFGLSEAGGMIGSDMVLYEASSHHTLTDAHVVESRALPIMDDCQDWTLKQATEAIVDGGKGWIILEMSRLLETGDPQDHAIVNDAGMIFPATRVIAAWGDSDSVAYHFGNKARSAVRLFSDLNESEDELLKLKSDGYFEIREDGYEIPVDDTTYHEVCKTFDDLKVDLNFPEGQNGVTMVGAIPVIMEETRQYIHHFTVYVTSDCDDHESRALIYAWAPGVAGWSLPDDVGFPIFDSDSNEAVFIEIHYDNPSHNVGKVDSSGIRFYYTNSKRDQDAAFLELGDPLVTLYGELINDGLTQYEFTCPGQCSSTFLGGESVTILWQSLHMHQTGVRMTHEVMRDGEVINKAAVDVYDFEQQGSFSVRQRPIEFMPGDSFRTTCYYRDGASFGLSSQEEMCIAFIMYYPAKSFWGYPWVCPYHTRDDMGSGCKQELNYGDLNSVEKLDRVFGNSLAECHIEEAVATTTAEIAKVPATTTTAATTTVPANNMTYANTEEVPVVTPSTIPATVTATEITIPSEITTNPGTTMYAATTTTAATEKVPVTTIATATATVPITAMASTTTEEGTAVTPPTIPVTAMATEVIIASEISTNPIATMAAATTTAAASAKVPATTTTTATTTAPVSTTTSATTETKTAPKSSSLESDPPPSAVGGSMAILTLLKYTSAMLVLVFI